MKVSTLCILLLAAHAIASPVREKRQYELVLAPFVIMGQLVDYAFHPIKFVQENVQASVEIVVGLELELAQAKKLFSNDEYVAITTTFDSHPMYPKDKAMKNDQDVDSLKLTGNEAAAAQYRKALKEILSLKQAGTASNIECNRKLNGANVDFLVSNGAMPNLIGQALKKLVGQ